MTAAAIVIILALTGIWVLVVQRLLQKAEGYVCTIKSGQMTFRDGQYLGVHPGKLLRGPQDAPVAMAAE